MWAAENKTVHSKSDTENVDSQLRIELSFILSGLYRFRMTNSFISKMHVFDVTMMMFVGYKKGSSSIYFPGLVNELTIFD